MIRITDVRVTLRTDAKLRAFASVTLEGVFVVRGLKIIEGQDGHLFVAMPSRKRPNGTYQDIAHPITPEFRNLLEDTVIGQYNAALRAEAREVGEPSTGT